MRSALIVMSFLLAILPWGYAMAKQGSLSCSVRPKQGTSSMSCGLEIGSRRFKSYASIVPSCSM